MDNMHLVYENEDFKIARFCMPKILSNMYVLVAKNITDEKRAIVIDPCISEEAIDYFCKNKIKDILILLTHEHYDHISGVNYFRERKDVFNSIKVICSSVCAENIKDPEKSLARYWEILMEAKGPIEEDDIKDLDYSCYADTSFDEKYELYWCGKQVKLQVAPGHSPGGCLIYVDEEIVFTGDNLVNGNGVICRWPGGSKKEYINRTKPFLMEIKENTIVCPGHGECDKIENLLKYMEMFKR